MAVSGEEEYDLKDEELVDFDGSDYGFESAEEEETNVAPEYPLPTIKPAPASGVGEIEDVKYGQGDGVAVQPPVVVVIDQPPNYKLPPKPDLEDGELDDAAMPEGSDPAAVANGGDDDEGENDRRGRKRRKDRYASERHVDSKGRRDVEETALTHSSHFRARRSEKMHESRRNNYSRGAKGVNTAHFQRRNSGLGIMGPGRPPVLMKYGRHIPFRSINRGFPRPIGGVVAPGMLYHNEVNMQIHIRDSMAVQEHILRQQQLLQMAQEQVQHSQVQAAQAQAQVQARVRVQAQTQAHAQVQHAHAHSQAQVYTPNSGELRPSLSGSTMRPIMGLDLIGSQVQGLQSMLHLQVQTPDLGPTRNFPRPLVDFRTRASQGTDFSAAAGSLGGPPLNQPSIPDRIAAGRQLNAWSPSSAVLHEILSMPAPRGRAQCQGRGQVSSFWREPLGGISAGFPSPLGVISHIVPIDGSPGIAPEAIVVLGTPKRQGSSPMTPNDTATNRENTKLKKIDVRRQFDGTRRANGCNRGANQYKIETLAPSSRNDSGVWSNSSPGCPAGNKRSQENGMDWRHSSKPASLPTVGNGLGAAVNNLIQIGGPITKSRVLSVSGFPENTSKAVVLEAFEKQGKILDFRKDEKGNAFHITFSSVVEAVSAKRFLHRTLLNGRQITVDYTVQRY